MERRTKRGKFFVSFIFATFDQTVPYVTINITRQSSPDVKVWVFSAMNKNNEPEVPRPHSVVHRVGKQKMSVFAYTEACHSVLVSS